MNNNKKVAVVLPAYNAAKTLEKTIGEIPFDIVDDIILCDDNSTDNTIEVAKRLKIQHIISHQINRGYGGNQKTLYDKAIALNADIVIMLYREDYYNENYKNTEQ